MRGKVSAKYPLTRTRVRMAVALVAAAPLAFTADNFPECTPAPACYPNRRAPHHGSLLNGACVPHPRPLPHATATARRSGGHAAAHAAAHARAHARARTPLRRLAAQRCVRHARQRSSTSGAVTRARTGSRSTTRALNLTLTLTLTLTLALTLALTLTLTRHLLAVEAQLWRGVRAAARAAPLVDAQRARARRGRRDRGQPEHVAGVLPALALLDSGHRR